MSRSQVGCGERDSPRHPPSQAEEAPLFLSGVSGVGYGSLGSELGRMGSVIKTGSVKICIKQSRKLRQVYWVRGWDTEWK